MIGQGALLGVAGLIIGLVGARFVTGVISNLLVGITPTDTVAFVAAAAVLLVATLLACVVPTRRALAVDPLVAMRAD